MKLHFTWNVCVRGNSSCMSKGGGSPCKGSGGNPVRPGKGGGAGRYDPPCQRRGGYVSGP